MTEFAILFISRVTLIIFVALNCQLSLSIVIMMVMAMVMSFINIIIGIIIIIIITIIVVFNAKESEEQVQGGAVAKPV